MPLLIHSHLTRDAKRYPAGTPPYADIIGSVSVSSAVVGLNWVHSITLEFRPESPLDHIEFSLAGQSFIGSHTVSYCGCSVTVSVVESTASYNMAELETPGKSAKSPKCKGAYTVPKAGKKASMSIAAPLAATQASTTSSVVIATVVVAVAIVAVGLLVVQRRIRRAVTTDYNEEVKPPTVANPMFEVDNDEEVKPVTVANLVHEGAYAI